MKNDNEKSKVKYIWIGIGILIVLIIFLIVIPLLIHIAFKTEASIEFFKATWSSGDVLSFYGTILSGIGTILLSALALYQNNRFQKNNEKLTRLQNVPYYSNVDLSIEQYSYIANDSDLVDADMVFNLGSDNKGIWCICKMKNLSEYPVYEMRGEFQVWDSVNCRWDNIEGEKCVKKIIPSKNNDILLRIVARFSWTQLKSMLYSGKKCAISLCFKNVNGLETYGKLIYSKTKNEWEYEMIPLELDNMNILCD